MLSFPALLGMFALGLLHGNLALATTSSLLLQHSTETMELWPAVRILADPDNKLDIRQALEQDAQFSVPQSSYASLGFHRGAVWLKVPVSVADYADRHWVFDLDYAGIERMDLFVVQDGKILQHSTLGNFQAYSSRPIPSRSHAVALELMPGSSYELLMRVESFSSLILPITLSRPSIFHVNALNEQLLQGLLTGLAVCLIFYSLAQWLSLREPLYLKYAILISGSLLFSIFYFGLGSEYLWRNNLWLEQHAGGIASMVAVTGSFLFIEQVLAEPGSSKKFSLFMKSGAVFSCSVLLAYVSGIIGTLTLANISAAICLLPVLMGIPGAIRRTRAGDSVGKYFLAAWVIYFFTTGIIIGVNFGLTDNNFWSAHSFQFGATFDMLMFLRVLGLRTKAIQTAALHTARERDRLLSLAHTDPLTGLHNRRGLQATLQQALCSHSQENMLAIYMMDLDGFKQVNDQHGHDVGDELLIAVSERLRANLRNSDMVARTGGDEFVVISSGWQQPELAHDLAEKLLDAFRAPFALSDTLCRVGITIGYVLAPLDGAESAELLKRADAAMYAGKQQGKHRAQRWCDGLQANSAPVPYLMATEIAAP